MGVKLGSKRSPDDMETDDLVIQAAKRGKLEENNTETVEAGLSEQPCRSQ